MTRLISREKSAFVWEIDGVVMKLGFNVKIDTQEYIQNIKSYKTSLKKQQYKKDSNLVNRYFLYFGSVPFIRIGIEVFQTDFIDMFRYYCRQLLDIKYDLAENPPEKIPSCVSVLELMTKTDENKCRSCFIMLGNYIPPHKNTLSKLFEEEIEKYWGKIITHSLDTGQGLIAIRRKISIANLTKYCMISAPIRTENLIRELAENFTKEREIISIYAMITKLFGTSQRSDYNPERWDDRFSSLFKSIVEQEIETQSDLFIQENSREIDSRKDCWKIYKKHGGNLSAFCFDFKQINSPSLRAEVKCYMRYRLKYNNEAKFNFVSNISHALNVIAEIKPSIRFMADVSDADAKALHMYLETKYISPCGNKLASATIGNIFACCSCLVEYLMDDRKSSEIKTPRPYVNPFSKFRFVNLHDYKKNTDVIPETVVEQLEQHIGDLKEPYELLYKIFANTGMRLKEALFLEADCLEEARYENLCQIKYKPYKVISARRRAGLEDYHRVLIPMWLAKSVKVYIAKTSALREISGLPYIFIGNRYHGKVNMLSMCSFLNAINSLIKMHNICDDAGELWHCTTRQWRKTIAVTLIENGATTSELAYWLGHLTSSTSMRYYAEVRKMKLAQLNTEFFRNKFELVLQKNQLDTYSEEERRLLYIDFRLEQRRVEFGFCLKKLADGGCKERNSIYNCVNCKHLCTGRQYLAYWQELLNSQKQFLDKLLHLYHQEDINGYEDFKEYKQAKFLTDCYENVVNSILGSEVVQ
jgi:integrase